LARELKVYLTWEKEIKLTGKKHKSKYLEPANINDADYCVVTESPLGRLCILASDQGVKSIHLTSGYEPDNKENEHTKSAAAQLIAFFSGQLRDFDLLLDTSVYSEFANKVWNELIKIPYGKTISYAELAYRLGDPLCIRAAAAANGRNPIPIIIPCHRVIGSDGSLTGFALGLDIKQQLLALENPTRFGAKQISLFE
jgi:methylated-DNA-[protein]-cysteine S-methyltransferase